MGFIIGALLGTFIASRLIYLLLRRWPGSYGKALAVNFLTAAVIVPLAAIGMADGGPARLGDSFVIYGLCALFLAICDVAYAGFRGRAPLTAT